jgi:hypothetical protein
LEDGISEGAMHVEFLSTIDNSKNNLTNVDLVTEPKRTSLLLYNTLFKMVFR